MKDFDKGYFTGALIALASCAILMTALLYYGQRKCERIFSAQKCVQVWVPEQQATEPQPSTAVIQAADALVAELEKEPEG